MNLITYSLYRKIKMLVQLFSEKKKRNGVCNYLPHQFSQSDGIQMHRRWGKKSRNWFPRTKQIQVSTERNVLKGAFDTMILVSDKYWGFWSWLIFNSDPKEVTGSCTLFTGTSPSFVLLLFLLHEAESYICINCSGI